MSRRLRIIADAHAWGVASAFARFPGHDTELRVVESREFAPETVRSADALVVRSSVRVDAGLLAGSAVRFVGTATVGDDHVDKAWLAKRGIAFASAAGSSTGSVVEYVLAALLTLHHAERIDLRRARLGVIGAGRIGEAVARAAETLGMRVLRNDPPRARREGAGDFSSLERLLNEADLLTLHTPLTGADEAGDDATRSLLDARALAHFRGRGVVNAARGGVVDESALLDWLNAGAGRFAALDCWENEPAIDSRLLNHSGCALATPHIAGHSLDGKAANTQYVHDALCRHLGVTRVWDAEKELPPADPAVIDVTCTGDALTDLHRIAAHLYDIVADDHRLRAAAAANRPLAESFRQLRRHYPVRRAWHRTRVRLHPRHSGTARLAAALGLRIE